MAALAAVDFDLIVAFREEGEEEVEEPVLTRGGWLALDAVLFSPVKLDLPPTEFNREVDEYELVFDLDWEC